MTSDPDPLTAGTRVITVPSGECRLCTSTIPERIVATGYIHEIDFTWKPQYSPQVDNIQGHYYLVRYDKQYEYTYNGELILGARFSRAELRRLPLT